MEVDSILKLIEAGFTKDEVLQLVGGKVATANDVNAEKEEQKTSPSEEKTKEKEEKTQAQENNTGVIEERLGKLEKSIQKQAILSSEQPKQLTTEEILFKMLGD